MVRDIQALRSFLKPTSDSSPAMMPSSHSGLVGTGVALDGGVAEDGGGGVPYVGGGTKVTGAPTTNGSLVADAGLVSYNVRRCYKTLIRVAIVHRGDCNR